MKCQVRDCKNEATEEIGIKIPDTATEIFRLLLPVKAHICNEHLELVKTSLQGGRETKEPPAERRGTTSGLGGEEKS
jgi:hypothetical protein